MALRLCYLPQRYVFAIMGFLITLVGYMMRIALDVTMVYMVNQTEIIAPPKYDPHSCPDLTVLSNQTNTAPTQHLEQIEKHPDPDQMSENHANTVVPCGDRTHNLLRLRRAFTHCATEVVKCFLGIFDWNKSTQKSITSAFSNSYIMSQLIAGVIAEKRGGKNIMKIAFTVLSTSTFVTPIASKLIGSNAIYVLRFISGLTSGVIVPALISMMSKWAPKDEQAFIASIIFPGSLIGFVAGSWLGDLMAATLGWEAVYYTFAVFGFIISFLWIKLVYSTPNDHPSISDIEKKYLNENVPSLERTTKYDLDPFPWKAVLRCGALWGAAVGYVGRELAFVVFATEIPQFMSDVFRLDITLFAYFVYTPYILMWLSALLFGFVCDILVKKKYCSVKNVRIGTTGTGIFISIISILMVMYSGCSHIVALFWMFTGMAALGAFYSGCMIGALDIAPNFAGSITGLVVTLALNLANLLPKINALVITDALLLEWRISFWVVIILLVISIAVYIAFVQDHQMWWDDVRKNGYPEQWKHGLLSCEGLIDENGKSIYKYEKDLETN